MIAFVASGKRVVGVATERWHRDLVLLMLFHIRIDVLLPILGLLETSRLVAAVNCTPSDFLIIYAKHSDLARMTT